MAMIVDEYWGQGGSYLLDPKTGKRKLQPGSRTEPFPVICPEEPNNATLEPQTPNPGKD